MINNNHQLAWAGFILGLAGVYNLVWGALIILAPEFSLVVLGLPPKANLPLIQCLGMIVGVYGIGYWISAYDPVRYWPLVLVGLIGKVLGPLGGIYYSLNGHMPYEILGLNVLNDFIWWGPFCWILWRVYRGGWPSAIYSSNTVNDVRSLYNRLLGEQFKLLQPRLQEFHAASSAIEVRGSFTVVRGKGALRNIIADAVGFPREAIHRSVFLRVEPSPEKELWLRSFGETPLRSEQKAAAGLLYERLGTVALYLQPNVINGGLVITSVKATILGFPLPPFFTPKVYAKGVDTEDGMNIHVQLELVPLGMLVEYSGVVGKV